MADEDLKQLLRTMLRPHDLATILTAHLPPSRECEICGETMPVGDAAINHIMSVQHIVGSPGHPGVAPWQCHYGEHWTCSPECWAKMAHKCIDEHMLPTLKAIHERLGNASNNGGDENNSHS